MVGSVSSDDPPGTSHKFGKPRSVAARWTRRRRSGSAEAEVEVEVAGGRQWEEGDEKMSEPMARVVYCG